MPYNLTNTTHQHGVAHTVHADLGAGERLVLPAHTSQVLLRHELPVSLRLLQQEGQLSVTFLPSMSLALTLLVRQTPPVDEKPIPKKKPSKPKPLPEPLPEPPVVEA